jgi:hypothetical protein
MPVLIVDRDGNVLPAHAIVFGQGYTVQDMGFGVVRVAVSGEVTREATVERTVTRLAATVTRWLSAEQTVERTVTRAVTREREVTRRKHLEVVTVTRDAQELTRDRFGRTATVDAWVTDYVTRDKPRQTVELPITATHEKSVTKRHYVTRLV